ncbi:MAG: hypothetical protein LBE85_12610 [Candidatus Accumulibacter sp.]|jgi:hypothetical protein|nr:hypothetical protein [Accumulibacter sp.]
MAVDIILSPVNGAGCALRKSFRKARAIRHRSGFTRVPALLSVGSGDDKDFPAGLDVKANKITNDSWKE